MNTEIRMKCVEVNRKEGWQTLPDGSKPDIKTFRFELVNTDDIKDPNSLYSSWSSGTTFPLTTINPDVNPEIGKEYMITITEANEPKNN